MHCHPLIRFPRFLKSLAGVPMVAPDAPALQAPASGREGVLGNRLQRNPEHRALEGF